MQFLIHGTVPAEVSAALVKKQHALHALAELAHDPDAPGAPETLAGDPAVLLPLLGKKQWHLITADPGFVRDLYEKKVLFGGVVVLLLADTAAGDTQAVERLFERYKRLTPGRLYTVTPNRVKIRQLPGAGAHRD
jgi:hypothetical protein